MIAPCPARPRRPTPSTRSRNPAAATSSTYLAARERSVGEIVIALKLPQPSVSKHLGVLRDAGLVDVRREGRQALYRTNSEGIRPLHEWASQFQRYWQGQLGRIKQRAERD